MDRIPDRGGGSSSSTNNSNRKKKKKKRSRPPAQRHAAAQEEAKTPLIELLDCLPEYLGGNANIENYPIDVDKARNVLEATAGNVTLAAQLYWDDYFATAAQAGEPRRRERPADYQSEDDEEDTHGRRVRRRLDNAFAAQQGGDANAADDFAEVVDGAAVEQAIHADIKRVTASVSDDEMVSGITMKAALNHRKAALSRKADSWRLRGNAKDDDQESLGADQQDDLDEYLSDTDWIWEGLSAWNTDERNLPTDLLWGTAKTAEADTDLKKEEGASGNVVDDEDDESVDGNSSIPRTWMNAGFSLSSTGHGLTAKPAPEAEVALFAWRQQQQNQGGSSSIKEVPPPFHCRAVTALLSIVTAMLYTGASIQGHEVNCTSSRKPFSELSVEEQKREFESRLADALSALLHIAAKASVNRKKVAIAKLKMNPKMSTLEKKPEFERRLRLCPTCTWEEDASSGESRLPEGRSINIATSFTNLRDLRAYVLSNMRAFTSRGGCALFLECILRIHGKGAVARMLQQARRRANLPRDHNQALIFCNCHERQRKELEENPPPASWKNDPKNWLDTSPLGHDCIHVELLSLLLTGRIYSSFKGWDTNGLGFGILSPKPGEMGVFLSRPEKPVWVLRGETCYSVLWVKESKENAEAICKLDPPGAVVEFAHWNCWHGQRNMSNMRMITARGEWTPPTLPKGGLDDEPNVMNITSKIAEKRRLQKKLVEGAEAQERENKDYLVFSKEALGKVKANADDKKFYPNDYRMWRFDIDLDEDEDDGEKKIRAESWTSYHRLGKRQKLLVEIKLGPKICPILWTRWPRSTIDKFTPEDGPPPVV